MLDTFTSPAAAAEIAPTPITPTAVVSMGVAGVLSCLGIVVAFVWGPRWTAAIGVAGMTRIALLSVVHFAISFTARIVDAVLGALTGPLVDFFSGIGGEVFPTLIQAVIVAIVRRPGALALSNLTVALLNGICAGQLGVTDLWFAVVGATLGELCLLLTGATRWSSIPVADGWSWSIRCAVGLAAYNGANWFLQYCMYQVLFRYFVPTGYLVAVVSIVGVFYGGLGAIVGARWGVRLREIC